jgi:hypothetical protein
MPSTLSIILGVHVAVSVVTFTLYAYDKIRAGAGGRRVPERTLHLLALFGGWPGAFAGQQILRHKTRKLPFQIVYWMTVAIHAGIWGVFLFRGSGR